MRGYLVEARGERHDLDVDAAVQAGCEQIDSGKSSIAEALSKGGFAQAGRLLDQRMRRFNKRRARTGQAS